MAFSGKLLLAVLLAVQVASLVALERRTRRFISQQKASIESHQGPSTPCSDAGYNGCCNLGLTTCYVSPFNCYCDLSCYLYGDCCQDIQDISCAPPGQVECPSLPGIPNGTIDFNPVPNPKRPGTIAHYTCNDGYALVGNSLRVCQPDMTWTGESPECRGVCPQLTVPDNGRISYEVVTLSNQRPVRTVAVYSCKQGFSLRANDNIRRVCQQSGSKFEWSGSSLVRCEPTTCETGFPDTGSCCKPGSGSCFVRRNTCKDVDCSCSCSEHCHIDQNCCPDVGCIHNNCTTANLPRGCCDWASSDNLQGCYVHGDGGCFCDIDCVARNDCCHDVDPASCTPSASRQYFTGQSVRTRPSTVAQQSFRPRPSVGEQQSVRTRPLYRAQLERYREGQAKKQTNEQIARELASEMRAMSSQVGGSNPDKKARWETIIEELKHIEEH